MLVELPKKPVMHSCGRSWITFGAANSTNVASPWLHSPASSSEQLCGTPAGTNVPSGAGISYRTGPMISTSPSTRASPTSISVPSAVTRRWLSVFSWTLTRRTRQAISSTPSDCEKLTCDSKEVPSIVMACRGGEQSEAKTDAV